MLFKEKNSIPYPLESIYENMENVYKIIDLNNDRNEKLYKEYKFNIR